MSRVQIDQAALDSLHAYHDGELSGFARWRLERRLRHDAALREELAGLRQLSDQLAGLPDDTPSPDLWESIALRLPALDARRAEAAAESTGAGWGGLAWRGALAASLVLAAFFALRPAAPPEVASKGGVVRWLDSGGRDVMVLEAASDTTIIWVFESSDQAVGRGVTLDVV